MNNSTSSEISETSEASASQELPLPENLQPPMANGEVILTRLGRAESLPWRWP